MGASDDAAFGPPCLDHARTKAGQAVPASHRPDQWAVRPQRAMNQSQCQRQVVDGVEGSYGDCDIISGIPEIEPVFVSPITTSGEREERAGVDDVNLIDQAFDALPPVRRGAADQEAPTKVTGNVPQTVQAILERPLIQEHFRPHPRCPVTARGAKAAIKQFGAHGRACAATRPARQGAMASALTMKFESVGRLFLDFALPPRCAGCAEVIEEVGAFCPPCWSQMEWLGHSGCSRCGLPLAGTEIETCGRCLAEPPKLDRMRAAVAYDELPRSIALKLKYGRKVALARTMARYMSPLKGEWPEDAVVVPVPLHRWRLWGRGFNQAALIARELAQSWRLRANVTALRRLKRTQPLKGLNHAERRKAVAGAFKASADLKGLTVILIDDVLTSGSTAEACARAIRRAGASRVELICWARVVRPSQIMR